jgi:DNA-binding NarL/FixJ family response regulator
MALASEPLRVVVADDSVLLREGLCRLLDESGCDVIAQAGDAEELLRAIEADEPDLAIVDIRMPPTHTDEGLRAARRIRREHAGVAVLVLSQYAEPGAAMELLGESVEGVGYLLKDRVADVGEFVETLRRVAAGGCAVDPAVVSRLVGRPRRQEAMDELTPREREVLSMMAEGRTNEAIAERLGLTTRAVDMLVSGIIGKLSISASGDDRRRVLAVLTFLRA